MSYKKFKLIRDILIRAKKDLNSPETLVIALRLSKLKEWGNENE